MLAIPVPFIVSMLLGLLAITLYVRFTQQAKATCLFLSLCMTTTAMVGLRWTFECAFFSLAQPILASTIPIAAWYTFVHVNREEGSLPTYHLAAPLFVVVSAVTQPWLALPLDEILTLMYVCYGIALIRYSSTDTALVNVSLGNWDGVKRAEGTAGWMLMFSAFIDLFMSLDFALNQGEWSRYIIATAHLILVPVLSMTVVVAGINTPIPEEVDNVKGKEKSDENANDPFMSMDRAQEISSSLALKIRQDSLYLDPELTLSKLTRKLGIPAKHISIAVNQVHQQNISRYINEYRIDHAKQLLLTTDQTITQIFMHSGFQTKSNFNREFLRITGVTPSGFRKQENK
ncbi:AraC family transcriptional regulator [Vibrio sp. 10N.261.55.A7]|uniref:helix-turn-helix domain-containing protein n=1 Tax=Vibrio sp. 10N.261.55.A7 TaxID=1880851 RepID=UPI000C859AB1|nr:AraC family transcriptional regulator [Vibrio sp. 10N.261.55.A7]PMJ97923.1 AraC family transcriptional regulator [Vibrio sp. 10N.261.55.A7]